MSYKSKIALENYSRFLVIAIGCWLLSTYLEDTPSVVLLKVLLVPFFFVARSGVQSFFKAPIVEGKFTFRAMECFVLIGIFEAITVFVIFWKPEDSIKDSLAKLGLALAFILSLQLLSLFRDIKEIKKKDAP